MLVSLLLCVAPSLSDDPVELRGAWISATDTSILASHGSIAQTMDALYTNGFNAVFVPAWGNGLPLFQSQVCEDVAGFSIDPAYKDRNPFRDLVLEAHRAGLEVFATFERGLTIDVKGTGHALLDKHPAWAACGSDKKPIVSDGKQFLAALDPDVQTFTLDLLREMLLNHEIDGFCLDGSVLPLPLASGHDVCTAAFFKGEKKSDPPADAADAPWTQWRAARLVSWMERFRQYMLAVDSNLLFVLSAREGDPEDLRDEKDWIERKFFDIWMPRVQAKSAAAYAKWLEGSFAKPLAGARPRFAAPMLIPASKAAPEDFVAQIAAHRAAKLAGETWASIPKLLANDAELFGDAQQVPYYVIATLPWRDGKTWRKRAEIVPPTLGQGTWAWRVDVDGFNVLESPGGSSGDASWSLRTVDAGDYELWTWIPADADLGKRASYTFSALRSTMTKSIDPSAKRYRGWTYIGRTTMKAHETREVMRLVADEKDESKFVVAGPLVALPARRRPPG